MAQLPPSAFLTSVRQPYDVSPRPDHDPRTTTKQYAPSSSLSPVRREGRGLGGVELTCQVIDVAPERFEEMVSDALDGLPEELGQLMSNVAVTVQHEAGPAGLLGLYQGIPLTRRTTFYSGALPDRITIYRQAICAVSATEREAVEQVRRTVVHEVGHHFGIGDTRLRELGW